MASTRGAVELPQAVPARGAPERGSLTPGSAIARLTRSILAAIALSAVAVPAMAQSASTPPDSAQRRDAGEGQLQIDLPGVLLAEPASEIALPISVAPIDRIPRNTLVRVRGLPAMAALSDGHSIAPGAWAVPVAALSQLRLVLPVGLAGKSEIVVTLVTLDGLVLAEAKTALVVGAAKLIAPDTPQERASVATTSPPPALPKAEAKPPPAPPAASRPPAPPPPAETARQPPVEGSSSTAAASRPSQQLDRATPPASTPPAAAPRALTPEVQARAQAMVKRGETLWRDGDVASARSFFERAAEEGLAEGALALGGTYDPYELGKLRARGPKADNALARRWYEKARDLGSSEATERLRRF